MNLHCYNSRKSLGRKKIGLAELLKDFEAYPHEIGPLARENIRQSWKRIHKFVDDVKSKMKKQAESFRNFLIF